MDIRGIINRLWYQGSPFFYLLIPFTAVYRSIIFLRRLLYMKGIKAVTRLPVPVIIVGNISVGGCGKTPLVIQLAKLLQDNQWRPGIVSRGYGGKAKHYPAIVTADSDPAQMGDEPVLIAQRTSCPVVVAPRRVEAAQLLLRQFECDVVISDDGLQHYALDRDIEIAVIDGLRRFGNGYCLPAGPLREPLSRLDEVDYTIINDHESSENYSMSLKPGKFINIKDPGEQQGPSYFYNKAVHAIAGIADPQRFFTTLISMGIQAIEHSFPDHHHFQAGDLNFAEDPIIIMTEKDKVKCQQFAQANYWYLPVDLELSPTFTTDFLAQLRQ